MKTHNRKGGYSANTAKENLSSCLGLIQQRQEILYDNPEHPFEHLTIVIDEVLALHSQKGSTRLLKSRSFLSYHKSLCLDELLKSIFS